MTPEWDEVLSLADNNGGDSDFCGFKETKLLEHDDAATSNKSPKRKVSGVKINPTKAASLNSVSSAKWQNKQISSSMSTNESVIANMANTSSKTKTYSLQKWSSSKKNTASKGKSLITI